MWRPVHSNSDPQTKYTALSVFCGVFLHQHMAVKDDDFLSKHTTDTECRAEIAKVGVMSEAGVVAVKRGPNQGWDIYIFVAKSVE